MNFDVAACKEGEGAGVWVKTPGGSALNYSYKLAFNRTNNVAEYEAMMLGIHILKYFQVRRVVIHWDSKFLTKQMQGKYQARHPRMRSYKNTA